MLRAFASYFSMATDTATDTGKAIEKGNENMSLFCVMTERTNYEKAEHIGTIDDCLGYFQVCVIDGIKGGVYICEFIPRDGHGLTDLIESVEYQKPIKQPLRVVGVNQEKQYILV